MSILKVIKRVIMICEEYNKPVNDIDVVDIDLVDGLLLVSLENGTNFSLAYRFMTVGELTDKVISACKWGE